jgi:molybdopterin-guanine dinucleotide biosynthesis protein MobB
VYVIGASDSGKTTLIERLIPTLRARGVRVGTVKHAHHGFALDVPGKDSWRHAQAGAAAVALISPGRAAWYVDVASEWSALDAARRLSGCVDLVLVEGFKELEGPKIVLEPGVSWRLSVEDGRCRLGVRPSELSTQELEAIADFCLQAGARAQ